MIIREFNDLPGISIGGRLINNLRYADDTAILAYTNKNIQHLMDASRKGSEDMGLSMKVKKSKSMLISMEENNRTGILVNNDMLEKINSFTFLGHAITPDARNDI